MNSKVILLVSVFYLIDFIKLADSTSSASFYFYKEGKMTTEELQEIISSKKKISLEQYKQILFELRGDCYTLRNTPRTNQRNFYSGEMNAFQIALDLAEQIKE